MKRLAVDASLILALSLAAFVGCSQQSAQKLGGGLTYNLGGLLVSPVSVAALTGCDAGTTLTFVTDGGVDGAIINSPSCVVATAGNAAGVYQVVAPTVAFTDGLGTGEVDYRASCSANDGGCAPKAVKVTGNESAKVDITILAHKPGTATGGRAAWSCGFGVGDGGVLSTQAACAATLAWAQNDAGVNSGMIATVAATQADGGVLVTATCPAHAFVGPIHCGVVAKVTEVR